MDESIGIVSSPEEQELEAKRAELANLSELLAERELELATVRTALRGFERRYHREVARKYVELDESRAQIAELIARQLPRDPKAQAESELAREVATATAVEYAALEVSEEEGTQDGFAPSEDLKKLYRLIALKMHPDKATDESTRRIRTKLMADANAAYAAGNLEKLREILREWEFSPDAVTGDGTAADLVRTIRSIAQVKSRLATIGRDIDAIKDTELYGLMMQVEEASRSGRDLLAELSKKIDADIHMARDRLTQMQKRSGDAGK